MYLSHRLMAALLLMPLIVSFMPLIELIPFGALNRGGYTDVTPPLQIKGVSISPDNLLYYDLRYYQDHISQLEAESYGYSAERRDLALTYLNYELDFSLTAAQAFEGTGYDYRYDAYYDARTAADRLFVLEHFDAPSIRWMFTYKENSGGKEDSSFQIGNTEFSELEFQNSFANLSGSGRAEAKAGLEALLAQYSVVFSDSPDAFKVYVEMHVSSLNDNITGLEDMIGQLRARIALARDPDLIRSLEQEVSAYESEITGVREIELFVWDLRSRLLVAPGAGTWQDSALFDYSNAKYSLRSVQIMDEREFLGDEWTKSNFASYSGYVAAMNRQAASFTMKADRALQSVTTGRPDLVYAYGGIRQAMIRNLTFSRYIFMLAAFIGAWQLASEFQSGTIRLLLIRPVSRARLLVVKFFAGLTLSISVYLAGTLIHTLLFGLLNGFSDLSNPVYRMNGQTGFLSMYLPQLAAAAFSFIFAYALAFFCSALLRNVAVSVAVPSAVFVASVIIGSMLAYSEYAYSSLPGWIMLTPFPYVDVSGIAVNNALGADYGIGIVRSQLFVPGAGACAAVLAALSLALFAGSVIVFRKTDVTS